MANKGKHGFRLTALSTALLVVHGPALAQDAEIAELTTPESFLSLGVGAWSDDRPQQGIYDGMRDKGGYLLLDGRYLKKHPEAPGRKEVNGSPTWRERWMSGACRGGARSRKASNPTLVATALKSPAMMSITSPISATRSQC